MVRTFRDDMADEFAANQLNIEEFAEELIYSSQGGAPRTIAAVVTRSQDPQSYEQIDGVSDRILVRVARGSTGVLQPLLRDRVELDGITYEFTGRIVSQNQTSYRLEFERITPIVSGNGDLRN